ncbi:MAG: hypothetical protein VW891_05555 [Novosphingobium sp.]
MEWLSRSGAGQVPEMPVELPVVEGFEPTQEEMEEKARNGKYYITNLNLIIKEYVTPQTYDVKGVDIEHMALFVEERVEALGCVAIDSSHRLNGVTHALQLVDVWHTLVREARTTNVLHIVRRTPQNSGAVLMIQRQETLRGNCSEFSPMAIVALVRSEQLMLQRHEITDQAAVEELMVEFAKEPKDRKAPTPAPAPSTEEEEEEEEDGARGGAPNAAENGHEDLKDDEVVAENGAEEGANGSNGSGGAKQVNDETSDEPAKKSDNTPKLKIEDSPELNMSKRAFQEQIESVRALMKAMNIRPVVSAMVAQDRDGLIITREP